MIDLRRPGSSTDDDICAWKCVLSLSIQIDDFDPGDNSTDLICNDGCGLSWVVQLDTAGQRTLQKKPCQSQWVSKRRQFAMRQSSQ
jgi:hypothetical protein